MQQIAYSLQDPQSIAALKRALGTFVLKETAVADLANASSDPHCRGLVFGLEAVETLGIRFFRTLRLSNPAQSFIAYVPVSARSVTLAFQLGRMGVDALCLAGDDLSQLRRTLDTAFFESYGRDIASAIRVIAPGLPRLPLEAAVLQLPSLRTPRLLAAALEQTLGQCSRTLRAAGLPRPRSFLAWMKVLAAAGMLRNDLLTAEAVALKLDYSSGAAMRNAFRRLLNATPTELRSRGCLSFAIQQLMLRVRPRPASIGAC